MNNIELSLKEMIIAVLHRWRLVFVFAVILALLMAGYGYFSRLNNIDALQNVYEKHLTAWEQSLKAKQSAIDSFTEKGKAAKLYNQESLLMQIDPYNKQVASLSLYAVPLPGAGNQTPLSADQQAAAINKLVSQYMVLAENAPLSTIFKGLLPKEYKESYLREIIKIKKGPKSEELTSSSPFSEPDGIITLTVFGTKEIDAQKLVEALYQYLQTKQALVTSSAGEHSLSILGQSTVVEEDPLLATTQATQRNLPADSSNQITTLMDEIAVLKTNKPGAPAVFRFVVKNGIIGGLLGVFLGIITSIFIYLVILPLQVPEQIQNQLGIRYLGGARRKYKGWLAHLGARLAGGLLLADEEEAMGIISANLNEAIGSHRNIMLTGTLPEKTIHEFAQKLSSAYKNDDVTLIPGADVNASADAITKLSEADAVILVERLQFSRFRNVYQEKERLLLAGKEILGYALY